MAPKAGKTWTLHPKRKAAEPTEVTAAEDRLKCILYKEYRSKFSSLEIVSFVKKI